MSRPQKSGLDYFPFDVGFYSDRKVKILNARYGSSGIMVYLYILCEIYKDKGYYIKFDEDFQYTMSADLGMNYEKIGQIIHFLLKRSLLQDTLFQSDTVLTSIGIQKRFQQAIKTRAVKNPVVVDKNYWLLGEDETERFIQCTLFHSQSQNNPSISENNLRKSKKISPKEKESIVKNNKDNPATLLKLLEDSTLSDALKTALHAWLLYKLERSEPYMPRGFQSLLTEVASHAQSSTEQAVCDVIRLSMSNNWKGIIWDKLPKPAQEQASKWSVLC